jgi:PIN domain nuclease of toxin-antitoxin system
VNLLLDTNAWLYSVDRPNALPDAIRDVLSHHDALYLSAISLWEVAKKYQLGKLTLSVPIAHWLKQALPASVEILPLSSEIILDATSLPDFPNRDPADELIVATARVHGLTLLTCDKLLRDYSHAPITYFRPKDRLA